VITFLYVLSAMWALGLLAGLLFMIFECETVLGRIFMTLVGLPVLVLLAGLPFAFIVHETGPVLVTLLKSEWHCSASHQETTTTYIQVGKVMVPSTTTHDVCDQYSGGAQ
jgi:hypothetical protein